MNPIKTLRLHHNLTQQQLADRTGLNVNMIKDTESGMYRTISPKILQLFYGVDPRNEDRMNLIASYDLWITRTRQNNAPAFEIDSVPTTFLEYTLLVGKGSRRHFCKLAVLQKSIPEGYIVRGYRWGEIEVALLEVGLSESFIALLHRLPRG